MFRLGFCVYGPQCRYKHTLASGPAAPSQQVSAQVAGLAAPPSQEVAPRTPAPHSLPGTHVIISKQLRLPLF